jgi:hypothetical protein
MNDQCARFIIEGVYQTVGSRQELIECLARWRVRAAPEKVNGFIKGHGCAPQTFSQQ